MKQKGQLTVGVLLILVLLLAGCTLLPTEVPSEMEGTSETEEISETENASDEVMLADLEGNPLTIPPILEPTMQDGQKVFDIVIQKGKMEFLEGVTFETMGYNGNFLGHTVVVDEGDDVLFNVTSEIDVSTTVHWHGLHVPPEMDGSGHQPIEPGETWQSTYTIKNEASTMWYHPHVHGTTSEQVIKGLAGVYIIHDENSRSLDIPQTYGVDDIPVVYSDRVLNDDGTMTFNGKGLYYGENILTNGTLDAYVVVPAKQVRLRLLNGSLTRIYNMGFADDREFHMIATDGGLLEEPVPLTRVVMAPGERAEIVIDVSDGEMATLKSYDISINSGDGGEFDILQVIPDVNHEMAESAPAELPQVLNTIERWTEDEADVIRPIVLADELSDEPDPSDIYIETDMAHMGQENASKHNVPINGKLMDMTRIDEIVMLDDIEIWEIFNDSRGEAHPLHIHDIQFLVLDRNGVPPEPEEAGWKDTVLVNARETVRVIAHFTTFSNSEVPYMYHCHFLEHEDGGMMGQFLVIDPDSQ